MFSKDTTRVEFLNQLVTESGLFFLSFFGPLDLNLLSSQKNSCVRNGGRFALRLAGEVRELDFNPLWGKRI